MSHRWILDYETRSEADLELVGAYEYARHPSTEILSAAWMREDSTKLPRSACPRIGQLGLAKLARVIANPENILVAQNAMFEQLITHFVLGRKFPEVKNISPKRWYCTMAAGSTHALPRALEGACSALKLRVQKDPLGKKLVRTHCMPQKLTKKNSERWNNDPAGLARLTRYCRTDVRATRDYLKALPPLPPEEVRAWRLNQKINWRGIRVDRPLVKSVITMIDEETKVLNAKASKLVGGGFRLSQRVKLIEWCRRHGLSLPNTQKKTIDDVLKAGSCSVRVGQVLKIRQAVSKTSTAKYYAIEARTRTDSRLRELLVYHGASTGRDAGSGAQIHNIPQGSLPDQDLAAMVLMPGDLKWARALLGDPMDAFSGALRGTLTASPGHTLYCGDWNAIEVRVLFWVARHTAGLDTFREGRDPYREIAVKIYRVKLKDVTAEMRDVGKRAVLGCGFGMGWKTFQATCEKFGVVISAKVAKAAVKAYRTTHAPVVALWRKIEIAATSAVMNPGKAYTVNRTKWFVRGKFLYCELPSGRRLAYCDPTVRWEETPWGQKRPVLYHWGIDPYTRKWVNSGTYGGRLCENIIQGTARDCMRDGTFRLDDAGFEILMTIHDEVLAEDLDDDRLEEFTKILGMNPKWAPDLPLAVKCWKGKRYRK